MGSTNTKPTKDSTKRRAKSISANGTTHRQSMNFSVKDSFNPEELNRSSVLQPGPIKVRKQSDQSAAMIAQKNMLYVCKPNDLKQIQCQNNSQLNYNSNSSFVYSQASTKLSQ